MDNVGLYWPWSSTAAASYASRADVQRQDQAVKVHACQLHASPASRHGSGALTYARCHAQGGTNAKRGGALLDISNLMRPQLGAEQPRLPTSKVRQAAAAGSVQPGGAPVFATFDPPPPCLHALKLGGQPLLHAAAERLVLGEREWVDVDKLNEHDPQACAAYASSIIQHLREAEVGWGAGLASTGLQMNVHADGLNTASSAHAAQPTEASQPKIPGNNAA